MGQQECNEVQRECQVLQLLRNSLRYQYRLRTGQYERSFIEKDLDVLADTRLNISQQKVPLQQRRTTAFWAVLRTLPAGQGKAILPLYFMLLRSDLGAGSSAGLPSTRETWRKSAL